MPVNFGLIDPSIYSGATASIFDLLNKKAQEGVALQGQNLANQANIRNNETNQQGNQMQYSAAMAGIGQRADQAQMMNQNQQQGLAQQQQQNQAQNQLQASAQGIQAQSVANQGAYQQGQLGLGQGQLAIAQQEQGNKNSEFGLQMMQRQMLMQAGQQGLPGIRNYYLSMGDYKAVQDIDKNGVDYNNAMLQGENSALDIQDKSLRYQALKSQATVAAAVSDISSTQDPALKQAKQNNFIENFNQMNGTDYKPDDPNAFLTIATKAFGTQQQMSALMTNQLTASQNADNMQAYASGHSPAEIAKYILNNTVNNPMSTPEEQQKAVEGYANTIKTLQSVGQGVGSNGTVSSVAPYTTKGLTDVNVQVTRDTQTLQHLNNLQTQLRSNPGLLNAFQQGKFNLDNYTNKFTDPAAKNAAAKAAYRFQGDLTRFQQEYEKENGGQSAKEVANAIATSGASPQKAMALISGMKNQVQAQLKMKTDILANGGMPQAVPAATLYKNLQAQYADQLKANDEHYTNNDYANYQHGKDRANEIKSQLDDIQAKSQALLNRTQNMSGDQ